MKRALSVLLACLLMCGVAMPGALAAEKTITSVEVVGNNVFDCCAELGMWISLEVSISLLVRYSDGSTSNATQPLYVHSTSIEEGLHEFVGFYQPNNTPDTTFQFTFYINAISIRDLVSAQPLQLNVQRQINGSKLECFSYTPEKTGWVNIAVAPPTKQQYALCYIFDEACSRIGGQLSSGSNVSVKMSEGKTYYLAVISPPANTAITLTPSEAPALTKAVLKFWSSAGTSHKPFQGDYMEWSFTVNGQAAPTLGFGYSADGITVNNPKAGTYLLQFTDYDGEDLGTLTVIVEDMTFSGWLADILEKLGWNNEDKTTQEWLKSIGDDIWLMIISPVIALMMFMTGPMGWILLPGALLPFIQLPIDIVGLFKSIFN